MSYVQFMPDETKVCLMCKLPQFFDLDEYTSSSADSLTSLKTTLGLLNEAILKATLPENIDECFETLQFLKASETSITSYAVLKTWHQLYLLRHSNSVSRMSLSCVCVSLFLLPCIVVVPAYAVLMRGYSNRLSTALLSRCRTSSRNTSMRALTRYDPAHVHVLVLMFPRLLVLTS